MVGITQLPTYLKCIAINVNKLKKPKHCNIHIRRKLSETIQFLKASKQARKTEPV